MKVNRLLLGLTILGIMLLLTACIGGNRVTPPAAYSVSGKVTTAGGEGVAGVTLHFSGSTLVATTKADGTWSASSLSGKVTVTPSLDGWSFVPASREVTKADSEVNFAGSLPPAEEPGEEPGEEPVTPTELDAEAMVLSLSFSPDGGYLVTGHWDRSLRIWDLAKGEMILRLTGHTDWVRSVSYSPKGDLIASSSDDREVIIWNAHTGSLVHRLKGHSDWVRAVAFSFDGTRVASGDDDNVIRIWDPVAGVETDRLVSTPSYDWIYGLAFSPDSLLLASGDDDGNVRIWDVEKGLRIMTITDEDVSEVYSVAFSPDGTMLAAGGDGGGVVIWNTATYEVVTKLLGFAEEVNSIAFSLDSTLLVTAAGNEVSMWNSRSGELISRLSMASEVYAVQFSPAGDYLAIGDDDGIIHLLALGIL